MKFNETNSINIPLRNNALIYFLINDDEVVYVGQTKNSLSRPFSHRDKKYNRLEIIECTENELDCLENKYILKYQPKYNTRINDGYKILTCRNKLRNMLNDYSITIRDVRKCMKENNLHSVMVGNNEYLTNDTMLGIYEIWKK